MTMTDVKKSEMNSTKSDSTAKAEPIRSSFGIDRYSREAIRRTAKWYDVSQGDVVNLAPLLFALAAERSLEERKQNLDVINTLCDQAIRSIVSVRSFGPHLDWAVEWVIAAIDELHSHERRAIESRQIHGSLQSEDGSFLRSWEVWGEWGEKPLPPSPFVETLKELQAEASSEAVPEITVDGDDPQREIDFQCCEGPREKELRDRLGDYFAKMVIAGILSEEKAVELNEGLRQDLDLSDLD